MRQLVHFSIILAIVKYHLVLAPMQALLCMHARVVAAYPIIIFPFVSRSFKLKEDKLELEKTMHLQKLVFLVSADTSSHTCDMCGESDQTL